ncbi:unnamed protein product [Polarella glacialis]|uniref:Uncharacterized protein n=1 Tax=Polarella glacialis TaxID=89957 RepID=A0A813L8P6_POLGL|nr:unnamed protein product [Polarella glacialis]
MTRFLFLLGAAAVAQAKLQKGVDIHCVGIRAHALHYEVEGEETNGDSLAEVRSAQINMEPLPSRDDHCLALSKSENRSQEVCYGVNQDASCAAAKADLPLESGVDCKRGAFDERLVQARIGGSFAVEWDSSPWGSYREVVAAGSFGAWASHVWVDDDKAAEGGRRTWGLPTSSCNIRVEEAGDGGKVLAYGPAPLIHIGDGVGPLGRIDSPARIVVGELPFSVVGVEESSNSGDDARLLDITLPNLSGGLPFSQGGISGNTDLLAYPLRLRAKDFRILPGHVVPSGGAGVVPRIDFSSWWPLLSIELIDVDVTAGDPTVIGAK